MRQRGGSEQPVKGRRANRSKTRKVSTAASPIADLQKQVGTLTRELKDSREQQTATSDILKVISRSTLDLQQVFETLAESAVRLCSAECGFVFRFDGQLLRFVVGHNVSPEFRDFLERNPITPGRGSNAGRAAIERHTVHNLDVQSDPEYNYGGGRVDPYRTVLAVPMLKADELFGVFVIYRHEVRPFNDSQIALMETFADQAVIAIENARLFNETREALQRQAATADILKVIASSPSDVQPVFEAIAASANRLLGGFSTAVLRFVDDVAHLAAFTPTNPAADEVLKTSFPLPLADCALLRLVQNGETLQFADTETAPDFQKKIASARGFRSILLTPLTSHGAAIGLISVTRVETGSFADHHMQLLRTFADQAVIAIENVRLFAQVQAKTRDLTEALTYQTGSRNILKVIASSPTDVGPVLKAIVESACELCDAYDAVVLLKDGDDLRFSAHHGPIPIGLEKWPINRNWTSGRAFLDRKPVHVHDLLSGESTSFSESRELSRRMGYRSILSVPMLRERESIGTIALRRTEVQPFSDKQISLLQTFADQAVIAIGNVRMFEQVQERTNELSLSLEKLRTAQDRLVQTQKLASLGQLTAGIAHEIKNPLNFVNNFSALSKELIDELGDALKPVALDEKKREELDELTHMLKGNLEKVVQHGKRADSIVKNMLLHSREGSGEHRPVDINAIVDESLKLAYHGARAEKAGFNITMQRNFDPAIGMTDVYPQELTRALFNLISNGFYATTKRAMEAGDDFKPTLTAATKNLGDKIEIRIRDNGTGIPAEVKEKIFNPFFTTKPAGEGTGLGLSMSHDIIVKQHGGTIEVETEPGQFTEFKIVLPRAGQE